MNRTRYVGLGLLVLTICAGMAYGANVKDFHTSWDAARQAAKAEGKPIYLHFTTTWCSWCRRIEADTYTSELGSAALAGFVAASLDCTDDKSASGRVNLELLKRFGGDGFPYLVMVTTEGIVLNTISGYVPPERFAAELDKATGLYRQWADFQTWAAKADRSGYEYHLRAMVIHIKLERLEEAAAAARQLRKLDPDDKRGHAAEAALALLREAYSRPKSAKQAEELKALTAEIRLRDPKNAKRVLQHVMVIEAIEQLETAATTEDIGARQKLLDAIAEKVTELQRVGDLPEEVQLLWAYLGQFNNAVDRPDRALDAYRKAIEAAPKSQLVPRITQLMQEGAKDRGQ